MALKDLAQRLDEASQTLAAVPQTLGNLGLGARAFGGDGPGQLGELGRYLSSVWTQAISDREQEAAEQSTRLADTAQSVRTATEGYQGHEEERRKQHDYEGGTN